MKIVLDTNIWISGIMFPTSKAGKILTAWKSSEFDLVTSSFILKEIKDVLLYPKIHKRIQWNPEKIEHYITTLQLLTNYISLDNIKCNAIVPKDAKDTPILQTFIVSQSNFLVTGDNDLLDLKDQYAIITLSEFYDMLN